MPPGTTVFATPAGPWDRISDPAVSYDPEHDVWMISGLAITGGIGKAVLVSRSTDGGLSWGNPVTVAQNGAFFDKEWIVCDSWAASPFFGNCYVEWDDAGIGQRLLMSRSTDGGQTWTPSNVPNSSVIGGVPVVQPSGRVVMPILGSGIDAYVSTDGGQSYNGPFDLASPSQHFVAGNLRDPGLVSAEVDASGRVFVAWEDCRFRAGCSSNDIVFSTSTNGKAWSAPTPHPDRPDEQYRRPLHPRHRRRSVHAGLLGPRRRHVLLLSRGQLHGLHLQAQGRVRRIVGWRCGGRVVVGGVRCRSASCRCWAATTWSWRRRGGGAWCPDRGRLWRPPRVAAASRLNRGQVLGDLPGSPRPCRCPARQVRCRRR